MKKNKDRDCYVFLLRKTFRIMKLTTLLILYVICSVSASTYAQNSKISINKQNCSIIEILKDIEKASEFSFFYNANQINVNKKINVEVNEVSINEVLNHLFKGTGYTYRIVDHQVMIEVGDKNSVSNSTQQDRRISGVVKDVSGEPIIGVNIIVKGTTTGVITDLNGIFYLNVPSKAVIRISYIGFLDQEITIKGDQDLVITLQEDTQNLDEVVVTAVGIKRASKAIGYAMTELKGDQLIATNRINPVASLQGAAPGVSVQGSDGGLFGSAKIQIRGVSTLNGNNTQPIFVIDGIILDNQIVDNQNQYASATNDFGNQLKNLNPDDFESVSILKGAASTALYGSRGMNGAVIITTKNPGKQRGLGISFGQTLGIDWVYDTPDQQKDFGPGARAGNRDYQSGQNKFTNNFDYEDGVPSIRTANVMGSSFGPSFADNPNLMVIGYDGKQTPYKSYKNNFKDAYDLGFNTTTSLTIQGGNDKTNFYLSDSYTNRTGTFPGNKFEKNSLLLKGNHALSKFLRADVSISINRSQSTNPPYDIGHAFSYENIGNTYDTNYWKDKWRTLHGGKPNSSYGDEYGDVPNMGLWFKLNNNKQIQNQTMILPIVRLTANILPELTISGEWNMNYLNSEYETKQLGDGYRNEGGSYFVKQVNRMQNTAKVNIAYNKKVNDFQLNALIAGELYFDGGDHMQSQESRDGLIVPGLYFIKNSKSTASYESSITSRKNIHSVYFTAGASWKDQLFVDVTGRNDWSTALVYSNATGQNSYFYPSVSGSWLFSETFNLPEWWSFGKIRASWAQVGNDTQAYRINQSYSLNNIQIAGGSGLAYTNDFPFTLISPTLKPERKNAFEVGLDIRFLKGRIGLDASFYKENTTDQIITISAPQESGITSQLINAGNMQNMGVELSLKTTPIQARTFRWDLDLNWNKNQNKIISLHKDVGDFIQIAGDINGDFQVASVAYIGGEYGTLISNNTPLLYNNESNSADAKNGKPLLKWSDDYQSAQMIRAEKTKKIGNMAPKFEGSMNNSFSYKNIYLNVLIDYRFGGYMASYSNRYGANAGLTQTSIQGMDASHGGLTWTSQYAENNGAQFHDGVIPDGVFQQGQTAKAPDGTIHDLSGMSYKEAVDAGYIEPTHASYWTERRTSWSQGVVTDDWFSEVKYIALRHLAVGYTFPNRLTEKFKVSGLRLSLEAQNLCYLYNSLPNHLNPESFWGNSNNHSYLERSFSPFTASYAFSVRFNM